MKTVSLFILLALVGAVNSQQNKNPPAHTNDVLAVKFSPDDTQLISYSWGDGWLILWEVRTGYLIWRAKTELVQRANERSNLQEFYWSEDGQFIVTKSENGTYQSWDAKTGKLVGVFDNFPAIKVKKETNKRVSVKKDSDSFELLDPATHADLKSTRLNSSHHGI